MINAFAPSILDRKATLMILVKEPNKVSHTVDLDKESACNILDKGG